MYYKYLEEVHDPVVTGIPGYVGINPREIVQFTNVKYGHWKNYPDIEKHHKDLHLKRIPYKMELNENLRIFPFDTIIGYDWHKDINNNLSNKEALNIVESWKPMKEWDQNKVNLLLNAIWSYKPGWTAGPHDTNLECEGESIITVPLDMIRLTDQEIIAIMSE